MQFSSKMAWSDPGQENTYESGLQREDYTNVVRFEFEFQQDQSCLLNALAKLKSQ